MTELEAFEKELGKMALRVWWGGFRTGVLAGAALAAAFVVGGLWATR